MPLVVPRLDNNRVAPAPLQLTRPRATPDGAGFEALGSGLAVAGNVAARLEDERDTRRVMESETALRSDWLAVDRGMRERAGVAAEGATRETEEWLGKKRAELDGALDNDRQRKAFARVYDQVRIGAVDGVSRHEAGQLRQATDQSIDASIKSSIDSAAADADRPGAVDQAVTAIEERVKARAKLRGYGDDLIAAERAKHLTDLHLTILEPRIDQDPAGARAYYERHRDDIAGSAHAGVERAINAAFERRAARQEALASRREAKADRALAAMDRQISAGVPATAEMWSAWGEAVRGTAAAAEFQSRQDSERDIQKLLRTPLAEQQRFVQERDAKIRSEGADLVEVANFNRLKAAVQTNITMLREQPLQFFAARTGEGVSPLDLGDLLQDGGTDRAGRQLAERLTTLDTMRRQYGSDVPMKPLLPQEAEQLTTALQDASPAGATKLLRRLRDASVSEQDFQLVLGQIAPDAPVKALAGMLAGQDKTITFRNRWFSPDVTGTSEQVAATMLAGDALLHPPKAAKGADGQPSRNLFLPDASALQAQLASAAGNAFRRRPDAAQVALQAAQAYYVGKASQLGMLSAQKADIDPRLVQEALTATVGKVVDFNGLGHVLAPWGMDDGEFKDRVWSAWDREIARLDLPRDLRDRLNNFSLENYGSDAYLVSQGNSYVTDKAGQPIVLRMSGAR